MNKTRQAKRSAIETALAEAGQGHFISQAAMMIWVDSWNKGSEAAIPKPDIHPDVS
jgi:predicted transcriptional regulator